MSETKQTKFDFDEIVDDSFLSVKDVSVGETVEVITNKDGDPLEKLEIDFSRDGEEENLQTVYVINCKYQDNPIRLRINKSVVLGLKQICGGKAAELVGKKFKIGHAGKGNFTSLTLLLTN